jgi:bifunctional DNA-binding transcriptional regulator/antitoxin component of YhaV-PrlF toxin-antitoxin module
MIKKVTKATVKGQITLPSQWRNQFDTNNFLLEMDKNKITIKPVILEKLELEEVIFDADRDNDGDGVSIDDMISLLKKVNHG